MYSRWWCRAILIRILDQLAWGIVSSEGASGSSEIIFCLMSSGFCTARPDFSPPAKKSWFSSSSFPESRPLPEVKSPKVANFLAGARRELDCCEVYADDEREGAVSASSLESVPRRRPPLASEFLFFLVSEEFGNGSIEVPLICLEEWAGLEDCWKPFWRGGYEGNDVEVVGLGALFNCQLTGQLPYVTVA
ncbi:hypothetical protein TMatcc_007348 [Talaromyces marneffei ATCC 18224]